jgi:hypothetical protein
MPLNLIRAGAKIITIGISYDFTFREMKRGIACAIQKYR